MPYFDKHPLSVRRRPTSMHNGIWLASKADCFLQGIGAAQDAVRMQNVVSFYEKLPRGAAPEIKAKGLLERYRARYFGKNASPMRALPYSTSTTLLFVANLFQRSYCACYRQSYGIRLWNGILLPSPTPQE